MSEDPNHVKYVSRSIDHFFKHKGGGNRVRCIGDIPLIFSNPSLKSFFLSYFCFHAFDLGCPSHMIMGNEIDFNACVHRDRDMTNKKHEK